MAIDPEPQNPPDWKAIAAQWAEGLITEGVPGLIKAWQTSSIETHGAIHALDANLAVDWAARAGELMHSFEAPFLPVMAGFVAPILAGLFGAEFNAAEFSRAMASGAGLRGAKAVTDGFMKAIVGDTPAEIVPTDAGSRRIAAAAVQASLESTFNAMVPEMLSHLLPFDIGHFEHLTELPESIIRSLGVSRLVRRAVQPIVTTTCTTPATWYMNKKHRPTLLGASALAKQIARNPAQRELWLEDLRREGYSEQRIEALLNEQAKFHSVADLDLLVRASVWSTAQALKHLQDQGYEAAVASTELEIEKLRRIAAFEREMASGAVTAYAAGRIDEGTLGGFATGATISAQEKAQYIELAQARRIFARQPITPSEAERCVKAGILSFIDYRRALERDGRDPDAVAALELLLRYDVQKEKDLARARAEQAAERAREKAARDAARAARQLEIDAARALARRGTEADLEAAAVRGLIPVARVAEVYAAKYDADTVEILVEELTDRRAAYVAQQLAAEDARRRAAVRSIDVGALERAVLEGVLTVDDFRTRLEEKGFTPADTDLLGDTLQARVDANAAAKAQREHAAAAAAIKHLDLGRMELLVRRGHRSLADYAHFLEDLGFDDGAIAAMRELLQIHIDDDAAAAAARAAVEAKLHARGLSLEQVRRAVILGVTPIEGFTTWLLQQGFTADAANTLRAELEIDRDEAAAAQSRRDDAERRSQAGQAPLADIRRAARLGLIPIDVYYGRLRAAGYTDDDVAIESDLLAWEIARDRTAQAAAAAKDAAIPDRGLTLAQLAAAAMAGQASVNDYRGRALALGFDETDTAILTNTLQAQLDATAAARRRKADLAAQGADRELARADVEKAVRKGVTTIDGYAAWLQTAGYTDDDAALLVALLEADLGEDGGDDAAGAP